MSFTVLSYNVNRDKSSCVKRKSGEECDWEHRSPMIKDIMLASNADIILLQEAREFDDKNEPRFKKFLATDSLEFL